MSGVISDHTLSGGDTEKNPGPKLNYCHRFFINHWNLDSTPERNLLKLSPLRAYITAYKFDVICLSLTYLDSFILHDDDSLQSLAYNLYREDHPLNTKR